jgi:hypothetical protein
MADDGAVPAEIELLDLALSHFLVSPHWFREMVLQICGPTVTRHPTTIAGIRAHGPTRDAPPHLGVTAGGGRSTAYELYG